MEQDAYKAAGVDIDAASATKRSIKELIRSTFRPEVLSDIGSFGGLFRADFKEFKEPVLVSSADGVGTKLKVACMTGRHDTVGEDLVNHCCNDILVMGAKPLFFLDYLAYSRHDDALIRSVIYGISKGCRENHCALIGGEMAELPDVYHPGEYDLAGVIVGIVDKKSILDGSKVLRGDILIGLASTGLHTNGYSLARKLIFQTAGLKPDDSLPGTGRTVADSLLAVHRSYAPSILPLLDYGIIHAIAHITGGGLPGNVNRLLPPKLDAVIDINTWQAPPVFMFLAETGSLTEKELYRTFNMGIGIVLFVNERNADDIITSLHASGETPYIIGRTVSGSGEVRLVHRL